MPRRKSVLASLVGNPAPELVEHTSLPAAIYGHLREAILSGNLQPGQVLRQEELAARFNTSRVPLREALQHLQADGLVVLRPRRGYAVTSLDEREVMGVLQLRMLVEGYAGYVATLARTEEDVKVLDACLREMSRLPSKEISQSQLARWLVLNRRFHDTLFAAARRPDLQTLVSNLSAKIDPYIMMELSTTQDLADGHQFHREIFEAFKAGDAAKVAILSRTHCELTAQRFLAVLKAKNLFHDVSPAQITDLGPAAVMLPPDFPLPTAAGEKPAGPRRPRKVAGGER